MKIPMKFVEFPHEDTFNYDVLRTCKNCSQEFSGRYCNRCGERVIVPEDRSLSVLFRQIFGKVPILDNKFMRTLRLMLTRTGFVAANYIRGRRIPFIDPLAMFLVINFLYFLFPTNHSYNSSLRTQMHFLLHNETATQMVEAHLLEENTTLPDFTVRYELHANNVAKIMLICLVLILAVPVWIGNYSSGLFFRDHLIVSMEFCTVIVLLNNIIIPWTWIGLNALFRDGPVNQDEIFNSAYPAIIMAVTSFLLFFLMEKRVYEQPRKRALFISLILLAGLFISLHLYYGVVFFISMWTL
jgi:hypothetical protein